MLERGGHFVELEGQADEMTRLGMLMAMYVLVCCGMQCAAVSDADETGS